MNVRALASLLRRLPFTGHGACPEIPRMEILHGEAGVKQAGHRHYVGGLWEEVGRLQFEHLKSEGLRPDHVVLDIACGPLRAGIHLIPYLDPGHYLGIDKESALIDAGVKHELGRRLARFKKPEFRVSADFDFSGFTKQPDFAIAQSLFSHLPSAMIDDCFRKLRGFIRPTGRFYATFFECDADEHVENPEQPHDHRSFLYTRDEMASFGSRHGWIAESIGGWNHPRGQVIARYRPC